MFKKKKIIFYYMYDNISIEKFVGNLFEQIRQMNQINTLQKNCGCPSESAFYKKHLNQYKHKIRDNVLYALVFINPNFIPKSNKLNYLIHKLLNYFNKNNQKEIISGGYVSRRKFISQRQIKELKRIILQLAKKKYYKRKLNQVGTRRRYSSREMRELMQNDINDSVQEYFENNNDFNENEKKYLKRRITRDISRIPGISNYNVNFNEEIDLGYEDLGDDFDESIDNFNDLDDIYGLNESIDFDRHDNNYNLGNEYYNNLGNYYDNLSNNYDNFSNNWDNFGKRNRMHKLDSGVDQYQAKLIHKKLLHQHKLLNQRAKLTAILQKMDIKTNYLNNQLEYLENQLKKFS
jgi:hypothetical protein